MNTLIVFILLSIYVLCSTCNYQLITGDHSFPWKIVQIPWLAAAFYHWTNCCSLLKASTMQSYRELRTNNILIFLLKTVIKLMCEGQNLND